MFHHTARTGCNHTSGRRRPGKIQHSIVSARLDSVFLLCSNLAHDRSTRKLAHANPKRDGEDGAMAGREAVKRAAAPGDPLPPEYWESVLRDPRAGVTGAQLRQRRLSEIQRPVLRVSCRRCERTVEIQTVDAVRLYGGKALWKDVGQRLLDDPRVTPEAFRRPVRDRGPMSWTKMERPTPRVGKLQFRWNRRNRHKVTSTTSRGKC